MSQSVSPYFGVPILDITCVGEVWIVPGTKDTTFGEVMGFKSPENLSFLANTHHVEEFGWLLLSSTESQNFY